MRRKLLYPLVLAFICHVLQESLSTHGFPSTSRRSMQRERDDILDWTREAQRNLSRWESRLLLNTLGKLHSSHVLGQVPFDLYDPVVTCPPPSKLMRLDPTGPTEHPVGWVDGAKWMCVPFPQTTRPGCMVLSFGSNNQFEFEQAALDMTPCTVHTFDCTTGMLGTATDVSSIQPGRHFFHPYCVGNQALAAENPSMIMSWEVILRVARSAVVSAAGRALPTHASLYDDPTIVGASDLTPLLPHSQQKQLLQLAEQLTSQNVASNDDDDGPHFGDEDAADGPMSQLRRRIQRSVLWGSGGGGGGGRNRHRDIGPEVFVLKIDVEGFEWHLLSEWGPRTPGLPAFLAIEIHNWMAQDILAPPSPPPRPRYGAVAWWLYGKRAAHATAREASVAAAARRQRVYGGELSLLFLHLARLGYAVVSRENNPNGDQDAKLCCAEFLLIRVRGPEEGKPGSWDWTQLIRSFKEGLAPLVRGAIRRRMQ